MFASIGSFFSGVVVKLLIVLAIVGTVAAILLGARNAGRSLEKVEGLERQIKNAREREKIERDVRRLPDGDAGKRLLQHWSRQR